MFDPEYKDLSDRDLLEEVDSRGVNLSGWEVEFVEQMTAHLKLPLADLNAGQREKLEQIASERIP